MITDPQDDVSQLGLDGKPYNRCNECGDRAYVLTFYEGQELCPDCFEVHAKDSGPYAGPFTVVLYEYTSLITGNRVKREYTYNDVYESLDFGLFWKARVYNVFGHIVMDYTKLPF